uniref:Secreted protein n=1 Tax=Panagrellus redivivus TaxID=6233 RepID=A0A7E4W9L3_PANRE
MFVRLRQGRLAVVRAMAASTVWPSILDRGFRLRDRLQSSLTARLIISNFTIKYVSANGREPMRSVKVEPSMHWHLAIDRVMVASTV